MGPKRVLTITFACVVALAALLVFGFTNDVLAGIFLLGMAVSADQLLIQSDTKRNWGGLAANETLYAGTLAFWNAAGYLASVTASGANRFAGIVPYQVVGTSVAGAVKSDLITEGLFQLVGSGFSQASVGKTAYATDNWTITTTKSPAAVPIGTIVEYIASNAVVVEIEVLHLAQAIAYQPIVVEIDCETGQGGDTAVTLIPAAMNQNGLAFRGAFGLITEDFGGASQDQGIITIEDSDGNAIATLTPGDASTDDVGDVIISSISVWASATGVAWKTVAAGKGIQARATQVCSGAGAAGKVKVFVDAVPLL